MTARAILILTGVVLAGCSGGGSRPGEGPAASEVNGAPRDRTGGRLETAPPARGRPAEWPPSKPAVSEAKGPRLRVLVTGFHDWHELGSPPKIWRCRANPSCRLLIGEVSLDASEPPDRYAGPLIERLERAAPQIEWSFRTLPVTWNVFAQVPTEHDVIINIGLGVYDRLDALQLERGAYNLQQGDDALGLASNGAIDPSGADVLEPPAESPIAGRIDALVGTRIAGYEILGAAARPDNSYLCNQTHWFALTSVHAGQGPREAYFLHIPYAANDDYEPLADAVAGVVLGLLR